MSIIRIETVFNIDLEFELAPVHKRIFAYGIDLLILVLYLISLKYVLYEGMQLSLRDNIGFDMLLISLPMLLYSLLMELWMNGQTVGKRLMSIRVISLDGGEPTLGQFMIRWMTKMFEWPFLFGYIIGSTELIQVYLLITAIFGIGALIPIAVTNRNQRLGDLAAGTVVVNTKSNMSIDDTVFQQVATENYQPLFPEVMRLSDGDINTIKSVLTQAQKTKNYEMCTRVEYKVKDVLKIQSNLSNIDFLHRLLEDYNYLATKEH